MSSHTPQTKRVLEKLLGIMKKYTIRIHFKSGTVKEIQGDREPAIAFNEPLRDCVLNQGYGDAPFMFRMSEIEGYDSEENQPKET